MNKQLQTILDVIDRGDACSVVFLIGLACLAGGTMVGSKQCLHSAGKSIAGGAFVLYLAYSWFSWHPTTAEDWLGAGFRGMLAAGLALGASWIVLSAIEFLYRFTIAKPIRFIRGRIQAAYYNAQSKRRREEESQRQREGDEQNRYAEQERLRIKNERRDREERDAAVKAQRDAQHQSAFARTELELLYNGHSRELENLLPRTAFRRFLRDHLSEAQSAEHVLRYATLLKQMIRRYLRIAIRSPTSFKSIPDIAKHFQEASREIDELPYDEETKGTLRAHLATAEEAAIERFLQQ